MINRTKWLESVSEMNRAAVELNDARKEHYELMSNRIKTIFHENSMTAPKIHFTADASKIECTWKRNTELLIPIELISVLGMSFDFDVEIATDGAWLKKLTFYPFDGGK